MSTRNQLSELEASSPEMRSCSCERTRCAWLICARTTRGAARTRTLGGGRCLEAAPDGTARRDEATDCARARHTARAVQRRYGCAALTPDRGRGAERHLNRRCPLVDGSHHLLQEVDVERERKVEESVHRSSPGPLPTEARDAQRRERSPSPSAPSTGAESSSAAPALAARTEGAEEDGRQWDPLWGPTLHATVGPFGAPTTWRVESTPVSC
jgi:hypothetical protein